MMRANCWIRCAVSSGLFCIATLAGAGAQPRAYAPGVVVVVYRAGTIGAPSPFALSPSRLQALQAREMNGTLPDTDVPRYTNDMPTNRALLSAGVERSQRLFANAKLQVSAAYRLTILGESVQSAIARLRAVPTVMSATPDWYVSPMNH